MADWRFDYWREAISCALDDNDIPHSLTSDQLDTIAKDLVMSADCESQASGTECIPDPRRTEIDELKRKLKREQTKEICENCAGKGRIRERCGPTRSSTSNCYTCNGEGYIYRD